MTVLEDLLGFSREELDALPDDKFAMWKAMVARETALRSPADFAVAHSHGQWLPYKHLVYTSDAIVDMVEHDACDMLIVEEPVRHGKTELCSRWAPAWFVAKHRKRVLLASYEADYAATHGRRVREIVAEVGATYGVHLDQTSKAAHRWEILGHDAGMNTAGAGGPLTGKGGHLNVLDDPIKNAEEANSAILRNNLWEWWNTTWLTRREPGTKWLLIMSRWHADDLVARLTTMETGMRVRRLRLPALAEEGDPLDRVPGQALCPERFDEVSLAGIRTDVGPYAWASLYQQRPMLSGGGMFRRSAFRYWRKANDLWLLGEEHVVDPEDCWTFCTMDPAFVRSRRSDFTVIATWAVAPTDPQSLLLIDRQRVRVEAAEHASMILDTWHKHHPAWVGIERQNATLTLFVEAQRQGVVVRELRPDKNKAARAEVAVALAEAGRIYFPRGAEWLDEWESELVEFPVGAHDDQVDVLAYAANELIRGTVRARHRKDTTAPSAEDRAYRFLQSRLRNTNHHPILGRM